MPFEQFKYQNQYNKEKYDRCIFNVPKGQKVIIEEHWRKRGYKSLNAYVVDLIEKDMNNSKNISVGDITQQGEGNSISIG